MQLTAEMVEAGIFSELLIWRSNDGDCQLWSTGSSLGLVTAWELVSLEFSKSISDC